MALPVISNVITLKGRKDGFTSSYAGARWIIKNPTPGTGIAGGTSLSRTAPIFAIYQTDQAATPPTERVLTLSTLTLSQVGTVAGGAITCLIGIDSTNRYSAGGTTVTPQRMFANQAITAGFTVKSGPTLTADGATDYDAYEFTIPAASPSTVTIDLGDAIRWGKTGTLMFYAFAATTAPTMTFCAEVIEGVEEI